MLLIISTTYIILTVDWLPQWLSSKEPACNAVDAGDWLRSWVGKIPWRSNGNLLQYSCLENHMDRGDWWATVHRVTKSWIQLKRLSTHTHMQFKYKTTCDKRGDESRFTVVCKLWDLPEEELIPMGRACKTSRRDNVEYMQGQVDLR